MTRENKKILIFVDTKVFADSLGGLLCQEPFNIKSTALHGDRSQEDRDRAFEDFKVGYFIGSKVGCVNNVIIYREVDIQSWSPLVSLLEVSM